MLRGGGRNIRRYPKNFTGGSQKSPGADIKALKLWQQKFKLFFLFPFLQDSHGFSSVNQSEGLLTAQFTSTVINGVMISFINSFETEMLSKCSIQPLTGTWSLLAVLFCFPSGLPSFGLINIQSEEFTFHLLKKKWSRNQRKEGFSYLFSDGSSNVQVLLSQVRDCSSISSQWRG